MDPEADLAALQLRRSLLETQMRQAVGGVADNERVRGKFQEIETNLATYDLLLAGLIADPSPERRAAAVPEFEVLLKNLEQDVISLTNQETNILFETIGATLTSQRTSQTFLLILSTLFLILIIVLILSLRHTVGQDFDRAYLLLAQELAERKRVEQALVQAKEEAEGANRAKSDFISLVSHELKVPMTSIQGYADLILGGSAGSLNEDQRKFLNTIRNSVFQMTRLVSDLADISRIEAGRLNLEFYPLSVDMLVDQVISSNQTAIDEKAQSLIIEVPDDLPPVNGDHMRLIQILNNLVSNAHKYTPDKGQITIRAEQQVEDTGNGRLPMVKITITDNGIGIHPDEQDQIFGKFFRATDAEARNEPGTGLGLNITRYLVEMHHGRIWFESHYRQGTAFHFTVPVYQPT
jgi:signal transduction histidine kinase